MGAHVSRATSLTRGEPALDTPRMISLQRLLAPAAIVVALSASACCKTAELNLNSQDNNGVFTYDVTSFTVKAGQKVHVTVKNNETMPNMFHNFVLVKPGTEEAVAQAGAAAGEANAYVKPGDANVLFASPQAKQRETIDFTFTAPAKGTYTYICTYPGHYQTMRGVLTVTE